MRRGLYRTPQLITIVLEVTMLGAAVTAGLAMFPDIDMRIPFIKHRGITHAVWFALPVALIMGFLWVSIGPDAGPLAARGFGMFGFLVGMASISAHLLGDGQTLVGQWRHLEIDAIRAPSPDGGPVCNDEAPGVADTVDGRSPFPHASPIDRAPTK